MALKEPVPLFVFPPLAAVDAASNACLAQQEGLHETLLPPDDSTDRTLYIRLLSYRDDLSPASFPVVLVPTLLHIAVALASASRFYMSYPLPHHALQRLFALMAERVLMNRSRDSSWNQRGLEDHLSQARRHLERLSQRIAQPAVTLHVLDQIRTDGADAANYLSFAYYKKLSPVADTF